MAKIYNNNTYIEHMSKLLSLPHVKVYKGLDRIETLSLMKSMDYAWCWREPSFETTTREISMKLIENAALGVPCICYPSPINISILGQEYPYYSKEYKDFIKILCYNNSNKKYTYSNSTIGNFYYSQINI